MIKLNVYQSNKTLTYGKKGTFIEGKKYWFKETRHHKVVGLSEENRWVELYPKKMTSRVNPLEKDFRHIQTVYVHNKSHLKEVTKEKNR